MRLLTRHLQGLLALAATFRGAQEFEAFAAGLHSSIQDRVHNDVFGNEHVGFPPVPTSMGYRLQVSHTSSQPLSDAQLDLIGEVFWDLPSEELRKVSYGVTLVENSCRLFYAPTWSLEGPGAVSHLAWHVIVGDELPALPAE